VQGREEGTSADKEVRGGRGSPETSKLADGSGGAVWSDLRSLAADLERDQRGNGEEIEGFL
jgi:hypothetical protein